MLAKVCSYGIQGLDVYPVTIEVDTARGLFSTTIVGLPDNAIRESRERVRSAIRNSGYKYPPGRVTINLSPANVKKEGPSFDLPIAIGLLAASEQIPLSCLDNKAFIGELSLDGNIRAVRGGLAIAMTFHSQNHQYLILPKDNACQASKAGLSGMVAVSTFNQAVDITTNPTTDDKVLETLPNIKTDNDIIVEDFCEVKGQMFAKRGLEIAAAGGHNVLMIGPPGSGKSMLAKRLPGILPRMSYEESLQTTKIYSVMGLLSRNESLIETRPFRSPHHTTSAAAIVGGGSNPKPGEITLSHNGVLFLDELPEFSRSVLESLRQPLEDKAVTISRAANSIKFPAEFMLIAAMNPCPCGFFTDPRKNCQCSSHQVQKYVSRISGPLLDRIDLHIEIPALNPQELIKAPDGESSQSIRNRTSSCREIQLDRFKTTSIVSNGQMNEKQIKQYCSMNTSCRQVLFAAIDQLGLSARAYTKILKIARTIADLDEQASIDIQHISEAIQLRSLDRSWWG